MFCCFVGILSFALVLYDSARVGRILAARGKEGEEPLLFWARGADGNSLCYFATDKRALELLLHEQENRVEEFPGWKSLFAYRLLAIFLARFAVARSSRTISLKLSTGEGLSELAMWLCGICYVAFE